jgi:predicted ATPase
MCKIKIHNLGPVKDVEFVLNRINVITGPQCSGKSTIAKVVCACSWLEKDAVRRQSLTHVTRELFEQVLFAYHQLDKYPKHDDIEVEYDGDALYVRYTKDSFDVRMAAGFEQKSLGKVAYLPAERNLAAMENVESFDLPKINIRGYLLDWFIIRTKYTDANPLELFSLGIKYYYSKEKGDVLRLADGEEIPLNAASSGLQSVTPLYAYLHYMTSWIYNHNEDTSYEKQAMLEKAIMLRLYRAELRERGIEVPENMLEDQFLPGIMDTTHRIVEQVSNSGNADSVKLGDEYMQRLEEIAKQLSRPHYSRIILEEPEMNLFPQSQIDLVYDMLRMVDVNSDSLFINTHSPYILYALNNCMLGGLVKDKIDDEELLEHQDSYIDPKLVSVWELRDGVFSSKMENEEKTIQDAEGLIRSNYFDRVMHNVMADYHNLMNYHD